MNLLVINILSCVYIHSYMFHIIEYLLILKKLIFNLLFLFQNSSKSLELVLNLKLRIFLDWNLRIFIYILHWSMIDLSSHLVPLSINVIDISKARWIFNLKSLCFYGLLLLEILLLNLIILFENFNFISIKRLLCLIRFNCVSLITLILLHHLFL